MFKCPSCGGEMQYSPADHKVKCQYCGSLYEVHDMIEKYKEAKAEEDRINDLNSYEGMAYHCTECGATLLSFDDTAITFCSYCGSQAMLEDKLMKQNNPDVVIPFQKSKAECIEAYKKKIGSFLFAPDYMKTEPVLEKFRGIYMPYGIYDVQYQGNAKLKGSIYAYRRGDYQYYEDYSLTIKDLDVSYEGVSFDLVSKFYDNFSTSIPFHLQDAVPFNAAYMAGYYADCLDVKADIYNCIATNLVLPDVIARLKKKRELIKYGCSSPSLALVPKKRVGMFPVYFLAVRNQNNDAVHYAVVNGQTGEVAIEIPIDFKKYCMLSLLIALIVFLGLNQFFTIKPTQTLGFSLVASILCFLFSKSQLRKITQKRTHEDDLGYQSVNPQSKAKLSIHSYTQERAEAVGMGILIAIVSMCFIIPLAGFLVAVPYFQENPGYVLIVIMVLILTVYAVTKKRTLNRLQKQREKILLEYSKRYGEEVVKEHVKQQKEEKAMRKRFLWKEIVAMILSIIIQFSGQAEDLFYYGAVVLALVLTILSFSDLVKEHNIIVSNKLPQLEKRGGDENA